MKANQPQNQPPIPESCLRAHGIVALLPESETLHPVRAAHVRGCNLPSPCGVIIRSVSLGPEHLLPL